MYFYNSTTNRYGQLYYLNDLYIIFWYTNREMSGIIVEMSPFKGHNMDKYLKYHNAYKYIYESDLWKTITGDLK